VLDHQPSRRGLFIDKSEKEKKKKEKKRKKKNAPYTPGSVQPVNGTVE